MSWKNIRLELAGTAGFPQGSASRAYLLRVPLDCGGFVDRQAFEDNPRQATVRRFWASEPDRHGSVEASDSSWIFRCNSGRGVEILAHFDPQPLVEGGEVVVREAIGMDLPFRVARVIDLRQSAKAK